jgi:signal recognition particle GTPase
MLDSLTENLVGVFKTLKGQKTINEGNIDDSLRSDLTALGRV